ncbi:MAG: uroporphyrinogen-III C-methyltransferase [Amphritea sp.]
MPWSNQDHSALKGTVFLVGAGPGDPDLLTVKALRLIQQANILVYDRLVSADIIALANPTAERIFVGKENGVHSLPQDQINQLLVDLASNGKAVVRLKGGDPYIFGRGGEEAEQLSAAGIPFQVVPGITAAAGCSAATGIPLTHRDHAQSVKFITGHLKRGDLKHDWDNLAKSGQTLVFYMGLNSLGTISSKLIEHGCSPDTPAALVQNGTTAKQRLLTGNLENIEQRCKLTEFASPSLIIIGSVVSLAQTLGSWPDEAEKLISVQSEELQQALMAI